MTKEIDTVFKSVIGNLNIRLIGTLIDTIKWTELSNTNTPKLIETGSLEPVTKQLQIYFQHAHNDWVVDLSQQGTEFQQRVWDYLRTIPLGETRTYTDVADALYSSPRAVGNACRVNPFVIVVPCHRVVSKSGLGGYNGQTTGNNIDIKRWLLEHERQ